MYTEALLLQTEAWTMVEGHQWRGHRLTVPLDWQESDGLTVEVYARIKALSRDNLYDALDETGLEFHCLRQQAVDRHIRFLS